MKQPRASAGHHRTRTATLKHKAAAARRTRQHALRRQLRAQQPLHIRELLHPAGLLTLLMVGVLFAGWTLQAAADTYQMAADSSAASLVDGAIITSPADGATSASATTTVEGTCPDNSYIKLIRNGGFGGAAWCAANAFAIQTTLAAGSNVLQAQDYNTADSAGPATENISVMYAPAVAPSLATPLTLTGDYHFHDLTVGSNAALTVQINGGRLPYTLHVTWSDGSGATEIIAAAGSHEISHRYQQAGYFPVLLQLSDTAGQTTSLQLAALVKGSGFEPLTIAGSTQPPASAGTVQALVASLTHAKMLLWLAWPTYIILVLMAISFWLGERQHVRHLAAQPIPNRSRPRPSR